VVQHHCTPLYIQQPKSSPKPSHYGSVSGFWPLWAPTLALSNTRLRRCHHLIHTMPPPPPITLHCHSTWRARNRAMTLGFVAFGPQPPLPPRVGECAGPPPPPPHPRPPLITPHRHFARAPTRAGWRIQGRKRERRQGWRLRYKLGGE
jgi:hypothetical protein